MTTSRASKLERRLERDSGKVQRAFDTLGGSQRRPLPEIPCYGLAILDENGVFICINDRICEMLGYAEDELLGRPVSDCLDACSSLVLLQHGTLGKAGTGRRIELLWAGKDGRQVSTFATSWGIFGRDGSFKGTVAIVSLPGEGRTAQEGRDPSAAQRRRLMLEVLGAQESERKRISRDLHDDVGQALTVLKLNVGMLTRNLPEDLDRLREDCRDLTACIDHLIEHVRGLARELSPSILEDVGLGAAVRACLQHFGRRSRVTVSASIENVDHLLPKEAEIIVYRIIQEALANITRHARAKNVTVMGGNEGRRLCFLVEDDGVGFDPDSVQRNLQRRSLGIALIAERVRILGGTLDLHSEVGKGTRIRFVIPVDD